MVTSTHHVCQNGGGVPAERFQRRTPPLPTPSRIRHWGQFFAFGQGLQGTVGLSSMRLFEAVRPSTAPSYKASCPGSYTAPKMDSRGDALQLVPGAL